MKILSTLQLFIYCYLISTTNIINMGSIDSTIPEEVHKESYSNKLKRIQGHISNQLVSLEQQLKNIDYQIKERQKDMEQQYLLAKNGYQDKKEQDLLLNKMTRLQLEQENLNKLYKFKMTELTEIKQFQSLSEFKQKYTIQQQQYTKLNEQLDKVGRQKARQNYEKDKIQHNIRIINKNDHFQRQKEKIINNLQMKEYQMKRQLQKDIKVSKQQKYNNNNNNHHENQQQHPKKQQKNNSPYEEYFGQNKPSVKPPDNPTPNQNKQPLPQTNYNQPKIITDEEKQKYPQGYPNLSQYRRFQDKSDIK